MGADVPAAAMIMDPIHQYPGGFVAPDFKDPRRYVFGAGEGAGAPDLNPLGDWTAAHDQTAKRQRWTAPDGAPFDDYGCVSHSLDRVLRMQADVQGRPEDYCDRWLVVASGTVPGTGNDADTVAGTVLASGNPLESDVPADMGTLGQAEYYGLAWRDYAAQAAAYNSRWAFVHSWVDMTDQAQVEAALKKGPLQIFVTALGYDAATDTWSPAGTAVNHAVTCLTSPYRGIWHLGDSYDHAGTFIKRMAAGTLPSRWAKLITARPKGTMTKEQLEAAYGLKDNMLVMLSEPGYPESGRVALYLDGHKRYDPTAPVDPVCQQKLIRDQGSGGLTKAAWDAIPSMDFKGNPLP